MATMILDVTVDQAAEQRSESSPRWGFASLGSEPSKLIEPRRGDCDHKYQQDCILCPRFAVLNRSLTITQGSESLTLGLTLIAAPQLVSDPPSAPVTARHPTAANPCVL